MCLQTSLFLVVRMNHVIDYTQTKIRMIPELERTTQYLFVQQFFIAFSLST